MIFTFAGTQDEVTRAIKKARMNNKKVEELNYFHSEEANYSSVVCEMTPYSQEELQEIEIYGNPDHEAYLCSDDYEADCKSEQWDWLKNE